MSDLLEVKNLSMHYDTLDGNVDAVKDVSFNVKSGESFGLVGESGCGKTSVAMTLLQFCLLYTSPSPRDTSSSRMPSSA